MDEGKRQNYLFEYLRGVLRPSMPTLPYDAAAARWHGWTRAALEQESRPPPFTDGQIAAIAATADFTVVTQNVGDFKPFSDLEERSEWRIGFQGRSSLIGFLNWNRPGLESPRL